MKSARKRETSTVMLGESINEGKPDGGVQRYRQPTLSSILGACTVAGENQLLKIAR